MSTTLDELYNDSPEENVLIKSMNMREGRSWRYFTGRVC